MCPRVAGEKAPLANAIFLVSTKGRSFPVLRDNLKSGRRPKVKILEGSISEASSASIGPLSVGAPAVSP